MRFQLCWAYANTRLFQVNDATILLRDIAGDAAQNTANKIGPSEEALNQIDQPADENTWHDVPDLSPANLKAQAKDRYNQNKPFGKGELKDAAGQGTQTATGTSDPTEAANTAQERGVDGLDTQGATGAVTSNLKGAASENVPEETKDKARNFQNRTKSYLTEKVPKERRDATIYRLKTMVVEIQSHSDCEYFWPTFRRVRR